MVLRHLPFEGLDAWEAPLANRYELQHCDVVVDALPDPGQGELAVVLGGPVGVNDGDHYPFLQAELDWLEQRLGAGRPTLGICLGAQLIAAAAGGRVVPGATREIGWSTLDLHPDGQQSCVRHLDAVPVFHWHSDNIELPSTATCLASTASCPVQAFSMGERVLGLQFHPEVTARALESWYVGHSRALAAQSEPKASDLRAAARRHADELREPAAVLLNEWLDSLGA